MRDDKEEEAEELKKKEFERMYKCTQFRFFFIFKGNTCKIELRYKNDNIIIIETMMIIMINKK